MHLGGGGGGGPNLVYELVCYVACGNVTLKGAFADGELSSLAALSVADSGAVPFLTSTPATQLPGKEAPKMMQPPTSFSGLAYFKPKPTLPDASRLLDSAGSASGMLAQPGFAFTAGPGANFKVLNMVFVLHRNGLKSWFT